MPALTGFDKKWVTLQIVVVVLDLARAFEDEDKNDDEDELKMMRFRPDTNESISQPAIN